MAKAPDVGMDKGDLKRLLNISKSEPVNCAIGLSGDGATGLVMLHKIKGSKAVSKELGEKFPDAKNPRWGTAQVDEDGVVKFMINKAASGMARRLTKSLKGTGFSKVKILLEDGTELEGAADEEEGATAAGAETPAEPAAPAEQEEPAATAAPDLAELEKELRAMIAQMATAANGDATKLAALKAAAVEGAGALKAKDAEKAVDAIAKFKEALGTPSAPAGTPAPNGAAPVSFVKMQKSRLLWDSARKKVAGEIEALKKEALDLFAGDDEEAQVMDALDQLDEITGTLDERLLDALDDLLNEQDPQKHAELLDDAKDVLNDYADFVKSNELVQKLSGDTPFGLKLSIGPTYLSVIKALQANLH